ncbi:tetratricopeptide repeat-containing serine protease family protein [Streptomyces sp. NPDC051976]|uniref:tetratricopeptide repeat-containing serine protease family protein n=1 Tax=Streptomyces sp. NPDC051976 TaxID=3154947 RepID=UPI00341E2C5B
MVHPARVVAVEGAVGPGSGYVVAPRLVLTSAHVVPERGGRVSLFRPGLADRWQGAVVWRGAPGGRDDAALVRIDTPTWAPPPGAAVRWGRLVTHRPGTACEAWGVPELVQRPGRATDTLQPSGTLNPGDRHVGNRYVMNIAEHPPEPGPHGVSPWGGMSGAALFCGDLLAGVIASDPAGRAHAHLEAVPVHVLMRDAGFRAALGEHAPEAGVVLEPVEWQNLAEAADPAPVSGPLGPPAALLRARRQVVPFRGRTAVLDEFRAWTGEPGFAARLLYGPGGQGKTRLAQHLADTLATSRWTALWLRPDAPAEALAVLADAAVPLLVVVDYAETRTPQLAAVLEAAARHGGGSAFKLLMLARATGDWWSGLQAASPTAEALLDGAAVVALPALEPEPGASRTEAYRQAVDGYAAHLPQVRGWADHDWPALAARLGRDSVLDRPGLETALTLHMTALADLLDSADRSLAAPAAASGVEDRLLVHEQRYWTAAATARGLLPALTLATLTDALTAAFLLGAQDRDEADALLRRVPGLADQPRDRRAAVRDWIATLYPPPAPTRPWDTLQPDRLTERFIGRRMTEDPGLADHLVLGATDTQAVHLLTVYTRAAAHPVFRHALDEPLTTLCVRHPAALAGPAIDVATQTVAPHPLLDALQRITDAPDVPPADLEQLADRLPQASHNLAPWAAHLVQLITGHHRSRAQGDPGQLPKIAMSLNNLSVRLGDLGRRWEALEAVREAVGAYGILTEARPELYLPHLAASLNNLSNGLAEVGRWEDGLGAITMVVKAYRELARASPDRFLPDLAGSLNNRALRLGALGRREEALEAITEAVTVYRKLAQAKPDALPELAASLNNLSVRRWDLGRREEALRAITEAVTVYRKLAGDRSDAYLSPLATSLNNLSADLSALGRHAEALEAVTEAVGIRRELARGRPDVALPDLATSVNNLGVQLGEVGRHAEALEAITEAVAMRRELARGRPDVALPDLAASLNNLALQLGALDRREEALEAITEAVDVYRGLVGVRRDAFLPHFAAATNNLAVRLTALGRREEALEAITEAVAMRRELARARPDAHRRELDQSLRVLSILRNGR